jgi:hypothetical protein
MLDPLNPRILFFAVGNRQKSPWPEGQIPFEGCDDQKSAQSKGREKSKNVKDVSGPPENKGYLRVKVVSSHPLSPVSV